MSITTLNALRDLYPAPNDRAVRKKMPDLDAHCRRFIELSPFLILSTCDKTHNMDASPRGGAPGFVKVGADEALLIPDARATTGSIRWRTSSRRRGWACCS